MRSTTLLLATVAATWVGCKQEDTSGFSCVNGVCTAVTENAEFGTETACALNCDPVIPPTSYNCQNGKCILLNDDTGTYASLSECHASCNSFTDVRDNQVYPIATMGDTLRWLGQNVRYQVTDSYLNPAQPSSDYGRLYTWQQVQQACPAGWHLPTDAEWKAMEQAIGMTQGQADALDWRGTNEGTKLKAASGWNFSGNGSNSTGFNAVPTGLYSDNLDSFVRQGDAAYFWTATPFSDSNAVYRSLSSTTAQVYRNNDFNKKSGLSCRCVQD